MVVPYTGHETPANDAAGAGPNAATALRRPGAETVLARGDDPPEPPVPAARSQRSAREDGRQGRELTTT